MDKVELLASSPLFEMLSSQELQYVAELARPRRFKAGETVFEEGELGDSVYVVASGTVAVLRRDARGELQALVELGAPQFFGEMSLVDKAYRSATVRARTDCELLHLTAENLTTFRRQHRDGFTFVIINIARMLSARLREANARLVSRG
jgi:CRP/FNR family transcriptional regulator, cyclic AMP receptor protein